MEDDTSAVPIETDDETAPFMHVDYRVFEVTVEGSEGDTLEEINEIVAERLAEGMADIEDLKRTDYHLESEYDGGSGGLGGAMHQ